MGFFSRFVLLVSLFVLLAPIVFGEDVKITGFVNDYAGVINISEKVMIESVLSEIYSSGVAQFSVITVKSLEGKSIESYSLELAQGKLGDSEKNNGLLLLISIDDRKYRFEVGRGLEGVLNDAKIGRIGRDYIVPNFRSGNYSRGVLESVLSVQSILSGNSTSKYFVAESGNINVSDYWLLFIFLLLFFIIPIFSSWSGAHKGKNKYFDAAAGAIILFGGGKGGSGGSGGFGGFGGGGFGGGGASGGW
jgi:uncharacterized protein